MCLPAFGSAVDLVRFSPGRTSASSRSTFCEQPLGALQTSHPQRRQWCLRRRQLNGMSQTIHVELAASGTHRSARCFISCAACCACRSAALMWGTTFCRSSRPFCIAALSTESRIAPGSPPTARAVLSNHAAVSPSSSAARLWSASSSAHEVAASASSAALPAEPVSDGLLHESSVKPSASAANCWNEFSADQSQLRS